MEGTIYFWDTPKNFGFAVTEEGKDFYVSVHSFTPPVERGKHLVGMKIRFDSATKINAQWLRMLNNGELRDDNIDSRNPRPSRRYKSKPAATNVVVIEEVCHASSAPIKS